MKKLLIFFLIILFAWFFYSLLTFDSTFTYESSDRGMAETEDGSKGRDLDIIVSQFNKYKEKSNKNSIKLMITSKKRWDNIFMIYDNLTNKRWKLPYMKASANPNKNYYIKF